MNNKSGQAMTEFVVAIVAIMVLLACILQVAMISAKQSELFIDAREEAAIAAMQDMPVLSDPDYIQSWTAGADESTYSADDSQTDGLISDIPFRITAHARPDSISALVPDNPLSTLHSSPLPQAQFGMVNGNEEATIELLPVIQDLLYAAEEIELEADVWLPRTGGIY